MGRHTLENPGRTGNGDANQSTTFAASGLGLCDQQHLLMADTSEAFTNKTVQLLSNRAQRVQLASVGREIVMSTYSWEVIGERLREAYLAASAKRLRNCPSLIIPSRAEVLVRQSKFPKIPIFLILMSASLDVAPF